MDQFFGRGLHAGEGALVTASRLLVEDSQEVGVGVETAGNVTLEHVVVRRTTPRNCVVTHCPDYGAGHNVGSYQDGSILTMRDFVISEAEICGAHVALSGQIDLESGTVSANTVGVCVQVDDYDISRLMNEVRFVDNEVNVQLVSLPVPSADAPAGP